MHYVPNYVSAIELEQGLSDVLASPRDRGRLEAIVVRPASDERKRLTSAQLTPDGGVDGDRWAHDVDPRSQTGRPDPLGQLSLMNSRILRQIAGSDDVIELAGDNLIVDLDLSDENLPPGSRLAVGDTVVIEVNGEPHTGCGKFQKRYGAEARAFINNPRGTQLHLRGRYAQVVAGGTIAVGDAVRKVGGGA